MSQLDDQRSIISTSTFFSWHEEDQDEEDDGEREPPEMKYCPDSQAVVKCEPEETGEEVDEEDEDDINNYEEAISSLNSIYGSGGDEEAVEEAQAEDHQYNSAGGGRGRRRGSRRRGGEDDSDSDWEEEWVKEMTSPKKKKRRGSRRRSPKKKASHVKKEVEEGEEGKAEQRGKKRSHVYKPISDLTPEQQEKRRAQWRMKDIKRSERQVKRSKKRIGELTPEQQERRRELWREQKMRKMERREVMLREVIKDELEEDEDWEDGEGGEGEGGRSSGGGGGMGRRKKIGEMTEEEREKWRARWRLDSARRIAKRKGLPVPEKLEDIPKSKSRDSSACSVDSEDDEEEGGNTGRSSGGRGSGGGGGGGGKRRSGGRKKRISEMTEDEKEKMRAKWRLERARKIARAKGLPVPEKIEDIPVKREPSAESPSKISRNTSGGGGCGGGGGGGSRKKRVADMTEEEKEAIRARWRLERQRKKERALGLPVSNSVDQCTSKPRNPRNVRTLKDAITEEEREKVRAQYKRDMERRRQRYKTLTAEQRKELYQKMKFYKLAKIANMSEDELKMYRMNQYFKYQAKKANLSEEQKERRRISVKRRSQRKWQEIKGDPERLQRLREMRKEYRQNLSPEKRERFLEKLRENARRCLVRKREAVGDFREVMPRGPRGRGKRGVEEWKWRKRLTEEEREKRNEWRRLRDKKRRLEQRLTMQNLMDGGMTMEQIMQQTETGQQRKRRLFKLRINKAKRDLRNKLQNHNLPPEEINQRLSELEATYQPSREFRPYKPRKDGDSERVDPKELEYLEEIIKNHPGAKIAARTTPAGKKKPKKKSSEQPAVPSTPATTSTPTTIPSLFTTPIPSTSKKRGRPSTSTNLVPKIENPAVPSTLSPTTPSTSTSSTSQLYQPPQQSYYPPQPTTFLPNYPNHQPQTHYPHTSLHQSFFPGQSSNPLQLQPPPQQYCPSSTTSSQYGGYDEASGDGGGGGFEDDSYHDDPNDNDYSPPPSSPDPPPPPPKLERGDHHYGGGDMHSYHQQNYFHPPPPHHVPPTQQMEPDRQNSYPSRPPRLPTTSLDPTKKPRVRKYYPPKLRPGAKPRTKRADVVRDAVCDECGKAFNSMYVREHKRIYHSPHYDPIKMECLICHERFKVSKKWYQHYLHDHLGQMKMRRGLKMEDVTIICEECGVPCKDNFRLKRHMFFAHGEGQKKENQFGCPVEGCGFYSKDGGTVQRHLRRVHAELGEVFFCTGKIRCMRCPRKDFKNEVDLRGHVKECHPESSFPCEWCGAVKFTQLALNLHYSTNKCAKRPRGAEKRGMKQVEGLPFLSIERAMVPCPICGRELRIMSLQGHLKGSHNVEERREWRCEGEGGRCGKVYKRREFYAGHLEEAHQWKWEEMRGMLGKINGGNLEGMVEKKVHWTKVRRKKMEEEGDEDSEEDDKKKKTNKRRTMVRGRRRKKEEDADSEEESSSDSEEEDDKKMKKKRRGMVRGRRRRKERRNIKVICEEEEDGGDEEEKKFEEND